MKTILFHLMILFLITSGVFGAIVEDWTGVQTGVNTGTYMDSNGSKIDFAVLSDSQSGKKVLQLTSNLAKVDGSYCGVWHNISSDLSKAGMLKFRAKSTIAGDIVIALLDLYNVQYIARVTIGTNWADVTVPLSSFRKDPYYTPPNAVTGHLMDLSKTTHFNLAPQMLGAAVILIGQVETVGMVAGVSNSPEPKYEVKDLQFLIMPEEVIGPISPYVYGLNDQDPTGMNATVRRLGGNRLTGYNWTNNYSNAGTDWKNSSDDWLCNSPIKYSDCDQPGAIYRHFVEENQKAGLDSLVTVQMAGYVAADKNGEVLKEETAPSKRWVPVAFNKKEPFTLTPNPECQVVYEDEFVHYLVHHFNRASDGGIKFYDLDNETANWYSKHPRIHPNKLTYTELMDKTEQLANCILKVDPSAMIFGPVSYGWQEFITLQESPDSVDLNKTYGTFLDYYLDKLQHLEKQDGKRLVHVLDLHWYPEAQGGGIRITENDTSSESIEARVQAPRSLWDPNYVEKSWITQWSTQNKPICLIPWVQAKIDKHYPGTKLSFSEYDYGGGNHVSGGIAQADVLGIFGKTGVFLSSYWGDLNPYNMAAFKIYRNYDGHNGTFGSTSVSAKTEDVALSSIYASTDPKQPGTLWLLVLNKSQKYLLHGKFNLQGHGNYKNYVCYGFDGKSPEIRRIKEGDIDQDHFAYSLEPLSATLFVCRGDHL